MQKLQIGHARPRGYESPTLFRSDTLLRIENLTGQVWEEMRFIEKLKRQIRKIKSG